MALLKAREYSLYYPTTSPDFSLFFGRICVLPTWRMSLLCHWLLPPHWAEQETVTTSWASPGTLTLPRGTGGGQDRAPGLGAAVRAASHTPEWSGRHVASPADVGPACGDLPVWGCSWHGGCPHILPPPFQLHGPAGHCSGRGERHALAREGRQAPLGAPKNTTERWRREQQHPHHSTAALHRKPVPQNDSGPHLPSPWPQEPPGCTRSHHGKWQEHQLYQQDWEMVTRPNNLQQQLLLYFSTWSAAADLLRVLRKILKVSLEEATLRNWAHVLHGEEQVPGCWLWEGRRLCSHTGRHPRCGRTIGLETLSSLLHWSLQLGRTLVQWFFSPCWYLQEWYLEGICGSTDFHWYILYWARKRNFSHRKTIWRRYLNQPPPLSTYHSPVMLSPYWCALFGSVMCYINITYESHRQFLVTSSCPAHLPLHLQNQHFTRSLLTRALPNWRESIIASPSSPCISKGRVLFLLDGQPFCLQHLCHCS